MKRDGFWSDLRKDIVKYRYLYLMALPVLAYYLLFHYVPMYGATIAFKDFIPTKGILGSEWIGFTHFIDFFKSYYFGRILRNTILINVYQLIFAFPAPIILALLLNELQGKYFKRLVQTATYLPHFISLIVICGIVLDFTGRYGVINDIIELFGGERNNLLLNEKNFRSIYIISEIWQHLGWNTIIYLAALTAINPELYEAASIDGAGRFRKAIAITIPGIMPTIITLFILQMGKMMNVGFEKIILLYNPQIYETADVISSFIYRKGLIDFSYSYSAAVGLFNSAINFLLIVCANKISRKVSSTGLW